MKLCSPSLATARAFLTGVTTTWSGTGRVTATVRREKVVPRVRRVVCGRSASHPTARRWLSAATIPGDAALEPHTRRRPEGKAAVTTPEFVTRVSGRAVGLQPRRQDPCLPTTGKSGTSVGPSSRVACLAAMTRSGPRRVRRDGKTSFQGVWSESCSGMSGRAPRLRLTMGGDPPAP